MLPLPKGEWKHNNVMLEENASAILPEFIWLKSFKMIKDFKNNFIGTICNKICKLRSRHLMGENLCSSRTGAGGAERCHRRDAQSDSG